MTASQTDHERATRTRAIADAWAGRLRRYAASVLRDEHLARDAVQDVLLRLCDAERPAPSAFDDDQPDDDGPRLRAWLFTATRNRCVDLLRREGRMSLLEDHPPAATQMRLATNDPDPFQRAETNDSAAAALAALDRLPPLQRDALRLKFSGEMSYAQIAEAMGKTTGHVGVLIHEGLKTLRRQLAQ